MHYKPSMGSVNCSGLHHWMFNGRQATDRHSDFTNSDLYEQNKPSKVWANELDLKAEIYQTISFASTRG